MGIAEQITGCVPRLTSAELRVAEAVLDDLKVVAFGTVAGLAARSGTSGPTVMRFAAKLGFDGFADLQTTAQEEIADALRPATERIRERRPGDVLARALHAALDNVRASLEAVDAAEFRSAVELLADRRRAVHVLAGEQSRSVGLLLATELDLLRESVTSIDGTPVSVSRRLAAVATGDVVVAVDHRRYERWIVEAVRRAVEADAELIAITDAPLSPLAAPARHAFVVSARGPGPFDSHVGALALVDALATGVAARLRRSAAARLDAVEAAWHRGDDLLER